MSTMDSIEEKYQEEIADLTEKLRLSELRGDSLDRVVGECVQTEIEKDKQIAALNVVVNDNARWMCEMLEDYKIKYDDHSVGRRVALNTFIHSLREQIAALKAELESHAWEISPAMAQAKIDELTAKNERLRDRLKAAEDVVSYLVIWGASPTDRLVELVEKSMTLRLKDKETLCIPSAVADALKGGEG